VSGTENWKELFQSFIFKPKSEPWDTETRKEFDTLFSVMQNGPDCPESLIFSLILQGLYADYLTKRPTGKKKGHCLLCWQHTQLAKSHIIPDTILKWISPYWIEGNNVISSKAATLPLFCRGESKEGQNKFCEEMLSYYGEEDFKLNIINDGGLRDQLRALQAKRSPNKDDTTLEFSYEYRAWLYYFIVSIIYRVTLTDPTERHHCVWPNMAQHHRVTLYAALAKLRNVLLTKVPDSCIEVILYIDKAGLLLDASQLVYSSDAMVHCFKVEHYKYTDHTDKYFLGLFGVGGLYFFLSCSVAGPPVSGSTLDLLRELYFPNNYFCCPISGENGLIQIYGNQYFDLPYGIYNSRQNLLKYFQKKTLLSIYQNYKTSHQNKLLQQILLSC
jgi:hypothetical protein